ncbi:MAG: hypothetical protein KGJ13_05900, partial [Patescibacteria group bacterium]|nr:hypothetical protein [Patescibacteria group bacterium]
MKSKTIILVASIGALVLFSSLKISMSANPPLDQYGGRSDASCQGGAQPHFYTEKIGSQWYLCTPAGHPMWAQGAYAVGPQGNATVKYGSDAAANDSTIARLKAWGFNFLDTYSTVGVQPWNNSDKLPTIWVVRPGGYGMTATARPNDPFPPGTLDQDIKDVENGMSPYFTNTKTGLPDWGDLNRLTTALNYLLTKTQSIDPGGLAPALQNNNSLDYVIGVAVEDSDQTWAYFTSGENDPFDTQPSGMGASHGGYMTAVLSPQQQADALKGSLYNLDQKVYAKKAWHDYLVNRYGTISALNSAWGSNYTTFDSSAVPITGEAVGTTDGVSYQFPHTIAAAGSLTPNSIQIFEDGVMVAGDCLHPKKGDVCNPAGGNDSGALYGTSGIGGYVTYSDGKINVSFTGNWQQPGMVNCIAGVSCTVSFADYQNPGFQVGDHIVVQGFPTTNFAIADATVLATSTGPVTFSGPWCSPWTDQNAKSITFSWTGGTVTNSGYCNADMGKMAKITIPAAGHVLTVNYQVNGWDAGGTGLMDEDGRPTHTWLGTDPYALTNANPNAAADMRGFLYQLDRNYFAAMRAGVRAAFTNAGKVPPMYVGPDTLSTWNIPTRKEVLQAAAGLVDLQLVSSGGNDTFTQPMLNFEAQWYGGPLLAGSFLHANADSPFTSNTGLIGDYPTQAARGAAFYSGIQAMLSATTTSGFNPYVGYGWWQYGDNQSENTNWGLVTLKDNAYDGHEDVTGSVPCSSPLQNYTCGGEANNYGDAITSVKAANALWFNLAVASASTSTPPVSSSTPDTIPPTITISAPQNNGTVSASSVTVTGTAADNVAVAAVGLSIDGGSYQPANGTSSWSYVIPSLNPGSHT